MCLYFPCSQGRSVAYSLYCSSRDEPGFSVSEERENRSRGEIIKQSGLCPNHKAGRNHFLNLDFFPFEEGIKKGGFCRKTHFMSDKGFF